ncbi:hypothetical protein KJI95_11110 [Shewanella sp. JM162201]|uniref:Uncharacterized protein n=1 Tax=Shewanella jiangmenensis TaxID=2837387 RepID=A0ABS5V3P6_9GAMM|nr:hypothetical protein [Shewanella jiangmenensis]MBT1445068.1 hypothetical protein [Shewanella jiangmenensis]
MTRLSAVATSYSVSLLNRSKLTPVTSAELTEYCYYLLHVLNDLASLATKGKYFEMSRDWTGTDEEIQFVHNSYAWELLVRIWDYAENGISAHNFMPAAITDDFEHFFKLTSACEGVLYHDGSFSHESTEIMITPIKLALKYFARLKLDTEWDLDHEVGPCLSLYPSVHETHLTSVEYALLAGLSHIGAVRNETCKKENPLLTEKNGNNIIITIEESRKKLKNKRKFVPTPGVNYGYA